MLGDLFGKEAADDFILRHFTYRDGDTTIATGNADYADLFRVYRRAGTIRHDPDFARRFARSTGTHSECVARRIARHLWELRRAGKMRLLEERPTELNEQVNVWAYLKAPCAEPLERELSQRLGDQASFDTVYAKLCRQYEGDTPQYTANPSMLAYVSNASKYVPTPVDLYVWSLRATAW